MPSIDPVLFAAFQFASIQEQGGGGFNLSPNFFCDQHEMCYIYKDLLFCVDFM